MNVTDSIHENFSIFVFDEEKTKRRMLVLNSIFSTKFLIPPPLERCEMATFS